MPKSTNGPDELARQLKRLKSLSEKHSGSKGFAHDYLRQALFVLRRDYANGKIALAAITKAAGNPKKLSGRVRLFIEATAGDVHGQDKARWKTILTYMIEKSFRNEVFNVEVEEAGGFAGIYSAARKKHKKKGVFGKASLKKTPLKKPRSKAKSSWGARTKISPASARTTRERWA